MELLVGLAVGAGVFYVWIWRRWRFIGAYRNRQAFERAVREARESASGPSPYRIATNEPLLDELRRAESHQSELVALGYRVLGDIVMLKDGAAVMATRMFVSADGATVGGLSVTAKSARGVLVAVSSYTGEKQISTRRGQVPSLAVPPFVQITSLPPATPIRELVAAHHAPADARRVETLEDMLARLAELRERTLAWRASLSPDELLDADLRGLLGKQYETTGKLWAARLRDKLPQATARRV
jgi:hypothetical protein